MATAEKADIYERRSWSGGSDDGLDLTQDSGAQAANAAVLSWDDWTLAAEVRRARRLLGDDAREIPSTLTRRLDAVGEIARATGKWTSPGRYMALPVKQPRDRGRSLRVATLIVSSISFVAFSSGIALMLPSWPKAGGVVPLGAALLGAGIFGLTLCVLMQLLHIRSANHAALDRICLVETRLQNDREMAILAGPAPISAPTADRRCLGTSKQSSAA